MESVSIAILVLGWPVFNLDDGRAEKASIGFSVMVITLGKFSNRYVGYQYK
jgi:hypothetical protein